MNCEKIIEIDHDFMNGLPTNDRLMYNFSNNLIQLKNNKLLLMNYNNFSFTI